MESQEYKRTLAGSVGAGMGALFNSSGRTYYILEHKTTTQMHQAGESQKIIVDQIELGRDSSCQVRFGEDCETVSRRHAAIAKDGDGWKIIQISQTNGTYVNGQPIQGEQALRSGDEIRLSSRGPVLGFIVPQGAQSMVSSIGLTERMSLFRQQALAPYKRALWAMGIILVLAIAGLVTWNVMQKQAFDRQIEAANAEISGLNQTIQAANAEVADLTAKQNEAELAAERLKHEMEDTKNKTQAQIDEANERYRAALGAAQMARRAAEAAREKVGALQDDLAASEQKRDAIASQRGGSKPATSAAPASSASSSSAAYPSSAGSASSADAPSASASIPAGNVSACYPASYFIKINKISVYYDNREIISFNTEGKIGGSAFKMADGRFITARRVIEPWLYYRNGEIGTDRKGNKWLYNDLLYCINNGCKVVSECTAYSPSGDNFTCRNTDFQLRDLDVNTGLRVTYKAERFVRTLLVNHKVEVIYWYTTDYRHDWAVARRSASSNGLEAATSLSRNPKAGTEVTLLGYPLAHGLSSMNVSPTEKQNSINVSGLNIDEIIELSSRRWVEGYDGAPALVNDGGQYKVIGILSHAEDGRDIVTPIHYVGMR